MLRGKLETVGASLLGASRERSRCTRHHHHLFLARNLICNFLVLELCSLGTFVYWAFSPSLTVVPRSKARGS